MASSGPRGERTAVDAAGRALERSTRRVLEMGAEVDPTSVHEARKAIRRLRAVLGTYRPLLRRRATDELDGAVRRLGRRLGDVRDLDVLHDRLAHRGHQLDVDLTPWIVELCWERARVREELRDTYASEAAQDLTAALVVWGHAPPFRRGAPRGEPVGSVLARRVRRPVAELVDLLGRAAPEDPAAELHGLRKRAKQTRYTLEVAGQELGGPFAAAAEELHRLTDGLGSLQDSVVARTWLVSGPRLALGTERDRGMLLGYEVAEEHAVRRTLPTLLDAAAAALAGVDPAD